jgi:hypothetical protein
MYDVTIAIGSVESSYASGAGTSGSPVAVPTLAAVGVAAGAVPVDVVPGLAVIVTVVVLVWPVAVVVAVTVLLSSELHAARLSANTHTAMAGTAAHRNVERCISPSSQSTFPPRLLCGIPP